MCHCRVRMGATSSCGPRRPRLDGTSQRPERKSDESRDSSEGDETDTLVGPRIGIDHRERVDDDLLVEE